MNLEPDRRTVLLPAAGIAALICLGMWFGCGSDRVRPVEECVLSADPLVFGEVLVGDSLIADAVVINTGRKALEVTAALVSADFRLAGGDSVPVSLAAGDTARLSVVYAPQTVGPKSAEIAFAGIDCPGVPVSGGTPKAIPGYVGSVSLAGLGYSSITPIGIAVGPEGNLYIDYYDSNSFRQRYPDAYSTVAVIAPDGTRLATWGHIVKIPDGLATCPDGTVILVDSQDGKVVRYSLGGGASGQVGLNRWSPGRFGAPRDVAVDEESFVYVADSGSQRVQKLIDDGTSVASWTQMDSPYHLHADRKGAIFVSGRSSTGDRMVPVAPAVAKFTTAGDALFSWVSYSRSVDGITTNGDGYYYFAVSGFLMGPIDGIMKVTPGGTEVARLSPGHAFKDVSADSSGNLYGVTADSLFKLTADGIQVSAWPYGGVGVAWHATWGLFVLGGDRVRHLTPEGDQLDEWGSTGAGDGEFNGAGGIAVAPDGTVFVADTNNGRIQKFAPDGTYVGRFGNVPDEPGWVTGPIDAAVSADGYIYLATTGDHRIHKFTPDGAFLTRWGGYGEDSGQFRSPRGLAVGGSGNVYVWDTGNHRIKAFDSEGDFLRGWEAADSLGAVEPWPGTGAWGKSTGIAVTGDDTVYLTDLAARRVVAFSADGLPLGSWGGPGTGPGRFTKPRDVAIGPDGRIYVLDYGALSVQIFQRQSP